MLNFSGNLVFQQTLDMQQLMRKWRLRAEKLNIRLYDNDSHGDVNN